MIKLENVSFRYPKSEQKALDNITLELEKGSFHFLCGASGAGKTTLFKMLYLELLPTTGKLNIINNQADNISRKQISELRRHMGIVFQDFRLLNKLTVWENVALPLSILGELSAQQKQAVNDILDWVGLKHKINEHPNKLSGGEKQRVAIARAVVNRPKLLIADEPTGNVDIEMGKRIMHLLCELNKHGTTVLVATHDQELINSFNYPRLKIDDGKLSINNV
ncbi:MAG TPA: cell division ATP-binding protein FtsE [Alphaproteobacteria bacterium]|nr:cell division ATP-binding protein FtsE [Alphaproteobacteria bacterium]